MDLEIIVREEFHENGQLKYTENIAVLPDSKASLYARRLKSPDGYYWIRVGKQAKYFNNGQLAWVLNYDNNGNVIKENNPSYRKDGTIIQY